MNCRQVHENIERYYEGVLPVADELGLDIHLVQCESCGEELGGIGTMVGECNDAFDELPKSTDLDGLYEGIEKLGQQSARSDVDRAWFRRKELVLHLMFMLVAIPVFWVVSVSAIDTYSAYMDVVPDGSSEPLKSMDLDDFSQDVKSTDYLSW